MALHSILVPPDEPPDLAMAGLGVLGDRLSKPDQQPVLADGIHLRWGFEPELGFPWYGFHLFRRVYRRGEPLLLSSVIRDLRPGPWPDRHLATPHGQFSSDTNLVFTDDFPPPGTIEFDLDGRAFLRFTLPPAEPARRVEARVGFRPHTGEPPSTRQCVSYAGRPQDHDANPKTEQGVRFEVRDQRGRSRPHTTIRSRPTQAGHISGLDCEWELEITLPRPAGLVELTLTAFGSPATLEAFNADGTTADTARIQHQRGRDPEKLKLTGDAIGRVVVRARQDAPQTRTLLHEICLRPHTGEPPSTRQCVSFAERPQDHDANPKTEQGVRFEVRDQRGRPRPHTTIRSRPTQAGHISGLDCEWELEITLPRPAGLVELTLTAFGSPATLEAFNADGTTADTARIQHQRGRDPEKLQLTGDTIGRVVVRARQDAPQTRTLLHEICLRPHTGEPPSTTRIRLTAFSGAVPVAHAMVSGQAGEVVPVELEFDAISAIELSTGSAALVDLGLVSVTQDATADWEPVPSFPAPMRLPVTQPDYPATPGQAEHLAGARALARSRIRYGLPGLPDRLTAAPVPLPTKGTVSVVGGSPIVEGTGTAWREDLSGSVFQVSGDTTAYAILAVLAPERLVLSRGYGGITDAGKAYSITEDDFGQLHDALVHLVNGGSTAGPMVDRAITVALRSPGSDTNEPLMPDLRPLDLVLLATLDPAVAQMVGLYWVDGTAAPGVAYDYLLVGDYVGRGELDPATILAVMRETGFQDLEGYIVPNIRLAAAPPLSPPEGLRMYALPASSGLQNGTSTDVNTLAGLRWDLGVIDSGELLPGRALLYHLWRADLGDCEPAGEPPAERYELLTRDAPVLVAEAELPPGVTPQRRADWPPFALHAIDQPKSHGWYSYRINGIDLFGRHSANSAAGAWYQWEPPPDPRPPYYQEPPGHRPIHPFALNLPDTIPPPPPTGVEAYALDPADPTVLKDTAYVAWWRALSEEQQRNLIGLRVRWLWTVAHAQEAPDLREFRIYYHRGASGQMNALLGKVVSVSEANPTENIVETSIANTRPAGIYAGSSLQIGQNSFVVVANEAGSPLRLQVKKKVGPASNIRPRAGESCTVAVPPIYAQASVSVANGSATVTGAGTNWTAHLTGMPMRFAGELAEYTVLRVDSPTQLTLNRVYAGANGSGRGYGIRHPLFVDYGSPPNWDERYHVVDAEDFVTVTIDGQTLRKYEVFLPTSDGTHQQGLPLKPSRAEAIAYAHIGVACADDKDEVPDDPKWVGTRWGNRPGNEGRMSPPAKIFRVLREAPKPPTPPPDAPRVFATPADYHGRSFYTYRWRPVADLKTHVFRALDDALFKADWSQRPRPPLGASELRFFPDEERWNNAKREQVAEELNRLNDFSDDATGAEQAMAYYRGLSNDALRVLAGLPANEQAFSQLTIQSLDPQEPDPENSALLRWRDRVGPDSPSDYTPDPNLRAYEDVLDGRSTNRYFYRGAYVDGAHNRGPLGLSSAPVYLPNVVPPRAPVITRIFAGDPDSTASGDRKITLKWASNREPDLKEYRVYRAESAEAARDIRLMTLVHTETALPHDPTSRPPEVTWTDASIQALVTYYYRVVAVDSANNESKPTLENAARAFDETPPVPPVPTVTWVERNGSVRAEVSWISTDETLLQRRNAAGGPWIDLTQWREAGNHSIRDPFSDPTVAYEYRIRSRKSTGATAVGTAVTLNPL